MKFETKVSFFKYFVPSAYSSFFSYFPSKVDIIVCHEYNHDKGMEDIIWRETRKNKWL